MKAKISPLRLLAFQLLDSSYEFIVPQEKEVIPQELFNAYSIDIDFNHQTFTDVSSRFQVFLEIEVNKSRKIAGYCLKLTGMGIFELDENNLTEREINNLKWYSPINMLINNLRNIISQTTAFGPMSVYLLPPINVMDLVKQKVEKNKKKEGSTGSKHSS